MLNINKLINRVITVQPISDAIKGIGNEKKQDKHQPWLEATGLARLRSVSSLRIQQEADCCEILHCCEMNNRYRILGPAGNLLFYAKEDTSCCQRQCCGTCRSFEIELVDAGTQETVLRMERPLRCTSCCCFCCLQKITAYDRFGRQLGKVTQDSSLYNAGYTLHDSKGNRDIEIKSPWLATQFCCSNVDFKLFKNGAPIGKISKEFSGLLKESFTDSDRYQVKFPVDLPVSVKATILAGALLIDFNYYETRAG